MATAGLDFLGKVKGLRDETIERAEVGFAKDVIEFEYYDPDGIHLGVKRRGSPPLFRVFQWESEHDDLQDGRIFYFLGGDGETGRGAYYLVEGETDALRLWQELDYSVDVYALSGLSRLPDDEYIRYHLAGREGYLILDNDDGSKYGGRSTNEVRRHLLKILPGLRPVFLPRFANDLVEYFDTEYLADFITLLQEANEPMPTATPTRVKSYNMADLRALDLTIEPPPVQWMVPGLIAQGDVVLVVGPPGLGKSMFSTSLAVAVAEGWDEWAGFPLLVEGNVEIVDEENPIDEVYRRIHAFSRTGKFEATDRMRYLHNNNLRLDANGDTRLFEDVAEFQPKLVVLDSLIRLHTSAENESGAMSAVFNDAIQPLSRQLGATVIVLHHTNKTETTNSFKATRGSGDIVGAPDAAIELRDAGDAIELVQYKGRRKKKLATQRVNVVDRPDGGLVFDMVPAPF